MNSAAEADAKHSPVLEITRLVLLVAVVLTLALYAGTFNNPPVFDDFFFNIFYNDHNAFQLTVHPRVIEEGTIVWLRHLYDGLQVQRLLNILLHAVNVALVAGLCVRLLQWLLPESPDRGRRAALAGFLAALVFLVHPVTVYAVAYLNQRSSEMAAMGLMLMLLAFWQSLQAQAGGRQWLFMLLTVLGYIFTLFCKEHAVMAPAVCLALAVMHDGGLRRQRLALLATFTALCAVIAWYVVIRSKGDMVLGQAPEYSAAKMLADYTNLVPGFNSRKMMIYSVQTQASLFFRYWFLWLVPNPTLMSVDIRIAPATSVISAYTIGSVCFVLYGLASAALLFFGKTRQQRFLAFSLLVPWLLFWTEFTSLRLQEIFVLYRSYIWFIAVMPLLALAFTALRTWLGAVCWLILFAVLILVAHNRIATFSSEVAIWQDAADLVEREHLTGKQPGVERIYYNLGTAQFNQGLYPEAQKSLTYAYTYLPISEYMGKIMFNLALTYKREEDFASAIKVYRPLVDKVAPENDSAWWLMGVCYEKLGTMTEAIKAYQRACELRNPYACERLKPGGHL